MKLLRSTFLAFYLTSNNNVSAFSAVSQTKSLSTRTSPSTPTLSMSIESLHETPKMQLSEEEILKESMFLQVVREVNMAKEYMDYLIEESGADGEEVVAKEDTEVAASDDIELFGGGGNSPSTSTPEAPIIYNPSLRTNLGSTILLSGTTDSNLLSILNNNFFGQDLVPNFNFEQIKCLVNDVKQTKKSAISREARYGGLLDKLVIEEASNSKSSLPTKEELEGVSSWIVQLTLGDTTKDELETIATLAKESTVKNVVVLIDGMASTKNVVGGWDSVVEASGTNSDNFACTLLAVGELYDGGKDGGYYHIGSLDTVDSISADTIDAPKLSKKKVYQLLAHALSLDSTVNQSLTAFEYPVVALEAVTVPYAEGEFVKRDDEGNEKDDEYKNVKMEGRMIQAMREMGFTPVNELDVLVGKGIEVSIRLITVFVMTKCHHTNALLHLYFNPDSHSRNTLPIHPTRRMPSLLPQRLHRMRPMKRS